MYCFFPICSFFLPLTSFAFPNNSQLGYGFIVVGVFFFETQLQKRGWVGLGWGDLIEVFLMNFDRLKNQRKTITKNYKNKDLRKNQNVETIYRSVIIL